LFWINVLLLLGSELSIELLWSNAHPFIFYPKQQFFKLVLFWGKLI
jgi:hypothetical protein